MFAKKNLVAVAALLAAAGAAQAQSSVKLYGLIDASFGSFENAHEKGTKERVTAIESGKMITSFVGLAGSEDLGGGLKAEFALETFLAGDTGGTIENMAGGFWGRAAWVGLSGGFGRVILGNYDNALFTSGYLYNPFGSSMGFSPTMRHYYALHHFPTTSYSAAMGFDTGFVNSVTYETPNFGGFTASAQFSPKESTADGAKDSYTVAANYTAGPLSAQLTYVKGGLATAYNNDQKVWSLGASYDLGAAKLFGQYTDSDNKTLEGGVDDKIWQLGVSVPLTEKASVLASFGQLKREAKVGGDEGKNEVFSLGYNYSISKRTSVYGVFTNDRQTDLESGQTFAVGIRHDF